VGATYTLRQTEGKWKFVIVVAHDPDTILRFA